MADENIKDNEELKEFNQDSLREIAKEIVVKRTALKVHSSVYIGVNILLIAINLLFDNSYLWFPWAMIPWGMALLLHAFNYFTYKNGVLLTGAGTAIAYHSFIGILVSLLLIFIDYYSDGFFDWYWWAVGPILASIIIHYYIYSSSKPKKGEDSRKSYIDRKVDRELEKLKKK